MSVEPELAADPIGQVREQVDRVLAAHLESSSDDLRRLDPRAALLVDEIARLVLAGGKRLRPAFCIWAYRAAGGAAIGEPIVRAGAAIELLHTMALIHDDLMDGTLQRRGVPSSPSHLVTVAARLGFPAEPARFARAAAILAGDLAAVLADRLFLTSGFAPAPIVRALAPYHEMRLAMAAGQLLDVAGVATDGASHARIARLKGGSYTVEGPLAIGAALAGARDDVQSVLAAYGRPLGEAFQLRDDLRDADAPAGSTLAGVRQLVERARTELRSPGPEPSLDPRALDALDRLAATVAEP
jgi:geranylgeranyl diphosphate synthase, type I